MGSGIDLIEIARVERVLARHGERFLGRLLAPSERDACAALRRPAPRIALCFAAKEAVMKAVGTGWAQGVRWVDIETSLWSEVPTLPPAPPSRPGAARACDARWEASPGGEAQNATVRLHGRVAEIARERGTARCWLAVSRSRQHAMAVALLEGDAP